MTSESTTESLDATDAAGFVTFQLDDRLLGVPIHRVQEINAQLTITPIPRVHSFVRGVINLRGEVVTVLDLKEVLRGTRTEIGPQTKNVIVQSDGELVGLLVDQIRDVIETSSVRIDAGPSNLRGEDGRFYSGVVQLESELVVLVALEELIAETRELRQDATQVGP